MRARTSFPANRARTTIERDEAFAIEGVTVRAYDGRVVLNDVTLQAERGTSTALVGHVGGGKTTILRLLAGLVTPASGEVRVAGVSLGMLSYEQMRAHRMRVGYAFESTGLLGNWTLEQNISLALSYHGLAEPSVTELAEEFRIAEFLGERPFRVNASVRKRALIARALAHGPELLLCDEPQIGLTPREARVVSDAIERRRKEQGLTVVLADHDGYLDPFAADHLYYVENGRLLAQPSMRPPPDRSDDAVAERTSLTTASIYRGTT